jgi:hypothetical protein
MRTGTSGRRRAQRSTNSLTRTVDTFAGMWIIVLSCSSRGVVMGRREDGAAVRESRRYGHELTGSMTGGNPRRRLMRRRGPEANVAFGTRAMAGLRSRAIGPGARSWLTGVAGPRSRKRGPSVAERRRGAPGGASFREERGDAFAKRPTGWSRRPSTGGLAHPRVCRRSAPLEGAEICNSDCGVPGADQRIRAAERWLARRSISEGGLFDN